MSRVGLKPISLPEKVAVKLDGRTVIVEGPKGQLDFHLPDGISLKNEGGLVIVSRARSVSVPVPFAVRLPVVVPTTPFSTTFPAPPTVRFWPAPVIAPDKVSVPASAMIVVAPFRTTAPDNVLVPLTCSTAPAPLTPVPERFSGSATVRLFWICKVAPLATVVVPAAVPNAAALSTLTIPRDTVVAPV